MTDLYFLDNPRRRRHVRRRRTRRRYLRHRSKRYLMIGPLKKRVRRNIMTNPRRRHRRRYRKNPPAMLAKAQSTAITAAMGAAAIAVNKILSNQITSIANLGSQKQKVCRDWDSNHCFAIPR